MSITTTILESLKDNTYIMTPFQTLFRLASTNLLNASSLTFGYQWCSLLGPQLPTAQGCLSSPSPTTTCQPGNSTYHSHPNMSLMALLFYVSSKCFWLCSQPELFHRCKKCTRTYEGVFPTFVNCANLFMEKKILHARFLLLWLTGSQLAIPVVVFQTAKFC